MSRINNITKQMIISIEIPDENKQELALEFYRRGFLSIGKTAEIAGISRMQLEELIAEKGIERPFTEDELRKELAFAVDKPVPVAISPNSETIAIPDNMGIEALHNFTRRIRTLYSRDPANRKLIGTRIANADKVNKLRNDVYNIVTLEPNTQIETSVSNCVLGALCSEFWDDRLHDVIYRYGAIFVHVGVHVQPSSYIPSKKIEDYLATWDYGQYRDDFATCLSAYGITPELNEIYKGGDGVVVDEQGQIYTIHPAEKTGKFRVWVCRYVHPNDTPSYRSRYGAAWLEDADGCFAEFASLSEACRTADRQQGLYSGPANETLEFIVCEL